MKTTFFHKLQDYLKHPPSFNLELLKLIAIFTMVVDHVHYIWFRDSSHLAYLVGLLAFPLFCLMLTYNYMFHSSNKKRMLKRLFIFIFISQIPYEWAFGLTWSWEAAYQWGVSFVSWFGGGAFEVPAVRPGFNIFVTLFLGLALVYLIETYTSRFTKPIMFGLCCALLSIEYMIKIEYEWIFAQGISIGWLMPSLVLDAGIAGIAMMPALYLLFHNHWLLASPFLCTSLIILDKSSAWVSIGILVLAYFSHKVPWTFSSMRRHKYFFYFFYPGHLAFIKLVFVTILKP